MYDWANSASITALFIWIAIAGIAYFLPEANPVPFYGLAACVGFVLGGVQALSRSLYGTMIPEGAAFPGEVDLRGDVSNA